MKRFAILRDVPPDLGWEDVDAGAIQNMIYMGLRETDREIAWEPSIVGVRWVRSYWEPGSSWGTCLYEGQDAATVRDWHELCQVPYVSIREIEVDEATLDTDQYPRGFHQALAAAPLIAIESQTATADGLGLRRIRTYRYKDGGEELQLMLPQPGMESGPSIGGAVRRVVEIRPEDYT